MKVKPTANASTLVANASNKMDERREGLTEGGASEP